MFSRLNVFRLLREELDGIRDHSALVVSDQPAVDQNPTVTGPTGRRDRGTLALLFLVPIGVIALSLWRNWTLTTGADLLSAFSLTAGVLLAVFALIAAWRERLANRIKLRQDSERLDRQRLDEAARHTLSATIFCVIGAGLSIVASATVHGDPPRTSAMVAAACYGAFSVVGLLILMVVLLVYDAFDSTVRGIEREKLAELSPEQQQLLSGGGTSGQGGTSP